MECIFKCGTMEGGKQMQCHSPDMTFFLRLHVARAVEARFAVHAGECTRGGWSWRWLWLHVHLMWRLPLSLSFQQRYNKLLCCLTGDGRHAGGPLCDDIQCICGAFRWQVDVWPVHVQRVQQPRRLLLHGEHTASLLHIGG